MKHPVPPPPPSPGLLPPHLTASCSLPVGSITAFAGQIFGQGADPKDSYTTQVEASGWMVCDGRVLMIARFPELFRALGYRYAQGDTPSSSFQIPDLQGYFLRGVDEAGKNDPDQSQRVKPNGQAASTPMVGSTQTSAFQIHEHVYSEAAAVPAASQQGVDGATQVTVDSAAHTSSVVQDSTKKNPPISANETRPTNIAVYYLIKFTSSAGRHTAFGDGSGG